jgi:hypothetical protein
LKREESDDMKEVVIRKVDNMGGYDYIIYPTSYINPLLNQLELNANLRISIHRPCIILFDLLLCNGNCFNRFCKGTFDGVKILDESLELVDISISMVKFVEKYYTENKKTLRSGVLVPSEYMQHC